MYCKYCNESPRFSPGRGNSAGGYRDYQELTLSRLGLKRIFGLTLTLALLLTLLSAIALAFVISERLVGAAWVTGRKYASNRQGRL